MKKVVKSVKLGRPVNENSVRQLRIKDLNLSSKQYTELQNKLTPIVQRTIQAERGRTATRGEAVVNRTAAKKVKAATKKIMGGK